jgi:uncharacterized protein YdhG (YjbR/CyaY superfamily)
MVDLNFEGDDIATKKLFWYKKRRKKIININMLHRKINLLLYHSPQKYHLFVDPS